MPALINIELYISLDQFKEQKVETLLSSLEYEKEISVTKSTNQYPNYYFSSIPKIKFYNYRRKVELKENWFAIEFCTEYENVLSIDSKQTIFNKGIKKAFLDIIKRLNQIVDSPIIVITSEIANGFFFEHKFGNKSKDFADFELGLIKKEHVKMIDSKKYLLLEETENYNIYIQDNEYVKWK